VKFQLTKHAQERIEQRFGISGKAAAVCWINQIMEHAKFVSFAVDETGRETRMYAHNGISILLDKDENLVVTVYKARRVIEIRKKVSKFVEKEMEKHQIRLKTEIRKLERYQAELELEKAQLKLELLRARSLPKQLAIQARINAIQSRIDELPREIHEIKRRGTKLSEGVAAYV
jgi:DNA integrity scanning protein DisA with diadenylate cyclase activity